MDSIALVDEQMEDGKRFLERLTEEGIPVTAAAWIKESEKDRWYLYLASPVVDEEGVGEVYYRIHQLIRKMPQPFWIKPLQVKAVVPRGPVAEALAGLQGRYPGRGVTHFRGEQQLGGVSVQEVYLYPPLGPVESKAATGLSKS